MAGPLAMMIQFAVTAIGAEALFPKGGDVLERTLKIGMCTGVSLGMFAYPLIEGVFGGVALRPLALLDFPNMIFICYSYNQVVLSRNKGGGSSMSDIVKNVARAITIGPPMLGIWFGLLFSILSLKMPVPAMRVITELASMNKMIVMVGIGVILRLRFGAAQRLAIAQVMAVKYSLSLASVSLGTLVAYAMGAPSLVRCVLAFSLCCPIPGNSVHYAAEGGCDAGLAASMTTASNIVAFPLLYAIMLFSGTTAPLTFAAGTAMAAAVGGGLAMGLLRSKPQQPGELTKVSRARGAAPAVAGLAAAGAQAATAYIGRTWRGGAFHARGGDATPSFALRGAPRNLQLRHQGVPGEAVKGLWASRQLVTASQHARLSMCR